VQIDTLIGPYRVLSRLGRGGMGEVWLAEDTRLDRQVALKTVRPPEPLDGHDASSRARLMREARAAAALNHPNIATVHDVLEDRGEVVIVFEYVEGETLQARITRGRIPAPEAVDIATQIAKALIAAHAHGIVHRDLKPANIILAAGGHVKVLDFGIARMLAVGTTRTAGHASLSASALGFVGTASYAAPEQLVSSAVDERADLYALGVVLFEMISGQRPFTGNDPIQLASSKLAHDAPPLSSTVRQVPSALNELVASLLSRERDHRPASAAAVLAQLDAIYGSDTTVAMPAQRSRNSMVLIALAVVIVMLGGYGVWQARGFGGAASTNVSSPPVIAVLPLANVSGDAGRDFIAAGIAESLITSLAALPTVTVLSRASVTEARGRLKDQAALTKDLGATYMVEGSVQESGGMLRVSVNLVRADRSIAWGDSVEGTFERIFELQSRLASALTNALLVRVSANERERMNAQPTTSPAALAEYWRGRALLERRDVGGNLAAAIAAFDGAITLDPSFGLAHAGRGEALWSQYVESRDAASAREAVAAGMTALRLSPTSPEVRYAVAVSLAGTGQIDAAIQELQQALALRPAYEDARVQLGRLLARRGDIDGAIAQFRTITHARPGYAPPFTAMGLALLDAGRYEESARAFERVAELQPDNALAYQQAGSAYHSLGDLDRAMAAYQRALAIRPLVTAYSNIGAIHHVRGEHALAIQAYLQAVKLRPHFRETYRNLGDAYLKSGRAADARAAYLQAVLRTRSDLQVNPRDARAIAALALYLQKAGAGDEALARSEEAAGLAPTDFEVLRRIAAVHALAGRRRAALDALAGALASGYRRDTARSEEDFESLRNEPRFQSLTAK
jgi:serine/threonine-protein kinase